MIERITAATEKRIEKSGAKPEQFECYAGITVPSINQLECLEKHCGGHTLSIPAARTEFDKDKQGLEIVKWKGAAHKFGRGQASGLETRVQGKGIVLD